MFWSWVEFLKRKEIKNYIHTYFFQIHLLVKNRKDGLMKSNKIETLLNEVHSQILVPKQSQRSTPASGIAPQIIRTTSVHGEAIHKRTGDTLRLECKVDGIPPPSIVWYKVSRSRFAL